MLIATGTGYHDCTAFDGFEIIAHPLPNWADRVFRYDDGPGVTCASHDIKLAVREKDAGLNRRNVYLLMHHGGGREVWLLPAFCDRGEGIAALCAMPERALYAVLYTMHRALNQTRQATRAEEGDRWRRATLDKRVKVKRSARRGKALVWCAPERPEGMSDANYKTLCAINSPSF